MIRFIWLEDQIHDDARQYAPAWFTGFDGHALRADPHPDERAGWGAGDRARMASRG